MEKSVYVTFNPNSPNEMSLAFRLQTIASLYGIAVELPDRSPTHGLANTQERIEKCNVFVGLFSNKPQKRVVDEYNYALKRGKHVIIIIEEGTKLNLSNSEYAKVFRINFHNNNQDEILRAVSEYIHSLENNKNNNNVGEALLAILAIGVGMWALSKLADSK